MLQRNVKLPTDKGEFEVSLIPNTKDSQLPHMVMSNVQDLNEVPLIRIHSECITGDVFGSLRCECGPQLQESLKRIKQESHGYLFYLRQEGRGIGLEAKMKAYLLQEEGYDTVQANTMQGFLDDGRTYEMVVDFLKSKGISKVRLLTNNPDKQEVLLSAGIEVERVSLEIQANPHNQKYLETKKSYFSHQLQLQ